MYLGAGTHWIVERVELTDEIMINNISYRELMIKRRKKNSLANINSNIETYELVKAAQLPTLAFYEKYRMDGEDCIRGEDLNLGNIIYVSPNTSRNMPTPTTLLINQLLNKTISNDVPSIFENKMMNNKISVIDNFDELCSKLMYDMEVASKNGIGMCEDAFFFGIRKEKNITIDYKIADFDTIFTHCVKYSDETVQGNQITALQSVLEFLMFFHEDNQNKKEYDNKLNRKIELLR